MGNRFNKVLATICVLLIPIISVGQEESDIDLAHIYNKWVFSTEESKKSIRVYRNEGFFENINGESEKPKRWRFAAHSDVFVNTHYPKDVLRPRKVRWCGNDTRPYLNLKSVTGRTKGKWELIEENGVTSLLLHYFTAEKGKLFQLRQTVRYLVVHLEEDLMELKMINGGDTF